MGTFSWKTADTKERIRIGSGRTVYLLQPNGEAPIPEADYKGYGIFSDIDVFDWLADKNVPGEVLKKAEELGIEKRVIGIYPDSAYYTDLRTGKQYAYLLSELMEDVLPFPSKHGGRGDYEDEVDGVKINDLIADGIFEPHPIYEKICIGGEIAYPLKFSYNPEAVYEELPPSEDDIDQGW